MKIDRLIKNISGAKKPELVDTQAVMDAISQFETLNNYISDQSTLLLELTQRQSLYNDELTQLKAQRDSFMAIHEYTETLHYIPMALEDATYTTRIYNATINGTYYNTQALVDSIRIQRNEILRLQDVNEKYNLSSQKNSLEIMKIQYAAMGQRHGLTRGQKTQLKELEKADMDLRIKTMENQIIIDEIKTGGLTAEERRLDDIKMAYNEYIYTTMNTYQKDLDAMNLNIKGKELLLSEYETAIGIVNANITTAQTEFWTEWDKIATSNQLNQLTKDAIFNDDRVKIVKNAQLAILAIRKAELPSSVISIASKYARTTSPPSFFDFLRQSGLFAPKLPLSSYQSGGFIPETGPYLLHKGETVIPVNHSQSINMPITINAMINNDMDINTLAKKLRRAMSMGLIDSNGITIARMR